MKDDDRPRARYVKPGEMLAMDPSRIHRGPAGFFWMMGSGLKPNERRGDVTIVHIRGELEHHQDRWGCSESYEGILERLQLAASGQDYAEAHEREHRYDEGYEPIAPMPPKRIVTMIDSPGGVVSGLNECHASIIKIVAANPEIEFTVYVNEMAASAAYALACAFPEIICPRSAILGSIGVISTMISQARKNAKDGFDVELLTSGARKADGHLHAPITEQAKAVELARVMKLAKSFWSMVSKARSIPIAQIQGFEAGIFLGPDAQRRKLADAVMSFDDVLLAAGAEPASGTKPEGGGNQTDRRLQADVKSVNIKIDKIDKEGPMLALTALITKTAALIAKEKNLGKRAALLVDIKALRRTAAAIGGKKLSALIAETETAIGAETDERKLSKLLASLDAYKKTEKHVEHTKSEEGDEDDDEEKDKDDEDDEDDDEEESSKKSKAAAAADDEEEAKSEEDEAKAALAAVRSLTGLKGAAALGALQALAGTVDATAATVAKIRRDQRSSTKSSLIAGAREKGQITKTEATFLSDQSLATVEGFVSMRRKGGFVVTDEEGLVKPKHVQPGTEESLPQETKAMIDSAVSSFPGDKKIFRETLVKAHLEAHVKQLAAATSGASSGRY